MAAVARKHDSRRVPYEKLRERLWASRLPWDDAAERGAIGAVLLAPNDWARKLVRRAFSGHFYDRGHGWLWEELGTALKERRLTDMPDSIGWWLESRNIFPRFRAQFFGSAGSEISVCLDGVFWWNANWYIDRILAAAKVRANVIAKADLLKEAIDASEKWWDEQ